MPDNLPYQVSWSHTAVTALNALESQLGEPGDRNELAGILRTLKDRLTREPLILGEVYRSRGNVAEHLAVVGILAIDFAVDQQRRLVLVRKCSRMSRPGG